MDLSLYGKVLWRFKWVLAVGFVLAIGLSFLSLVSISFSHGIRYRQPQTWQAQSTLLLTQKGFTVGRSVVPTQVPPASAIGKTLTIVPKYADDSRFSGLAMLYASLATSDDVMKLMKKTGPPVRPGTVDAEPVYTSGGSSTLPLIQISGFATTPAAALHLADRATKAFESYLASQQTAAQIPDDQRVLVQELNQPRVPTLRAGRKKTIPVLIFIAIMTIAVGLAFILENIRPRLQEIPLQMQPSLPVEARRSA